MLGFLFAGIFKAFIPPEALFKHLGEKGLKTVLMVTLIGIPLPLCSCGVIPTGIAIYRQGASKAATLAFFIATPATTITTILLVWGMLGWKFMVAEVLASFGIALITGILSQTLLKEAPRGENTSFQTGRHTFHLREVSTCEECQQEFKARVKEVFHYGFVKMIDEIGIYLLIGLIGAGVISALIPTGMIGYYLGSGILPILVIVLIATPMYICSTASVPFAAALISKGFHPAAGLVFLIAGPATNLSTVLAIAKSMDKRTATLYLGSIILLSILIAYSLEMGGWL